MQDETTDAAIQKALAHIATLSKTLERWDQEMDNCAKRIGRLSNRILELEPIVCAIHGTDTNLGLSVTYVNGVINFSILGCCDSVRVRALDCLRPLL